MISHGTSFRSYYGSSKFKASYKVQLLIQSRIENSSIPISTCGPVLRLFARTFSERQRNDSAYGSGSGARARRSGQTANLSGQSDQPGSLNGRGFRRLSSRAARFGANMTGITLTDSEIYLSDTKRLSDRCPIVVRTDFEVHTEHKSKDLDV